MLKLMVRHRRKLVPPRLEAVGAERGEAEPEGSCGGMLTGLLAGRATGATVCGGRDAASSEDSAARLAT